MKIHFLLLLCVGNYFAVRGQASEDAIRVLSKVDKKGVSLRWAPSNPNVWQMGNKHGYILERYALNKSGEIVNKEPVRLSSSPLKPFSEQELEELSKTIPQASAIGELIYESDGKSNNKKQEETFETILNKKDESENRFGLALLLCDFYPSLSKAAGLFFYDSTALRESRYIYKVSLNNAAALKAEPGVIVVDVVEPKPLQPFNDLEVTFGDQKATLSWPIFLHKGIYTGYYIEKSEDGKLFKSVTDVPYVPMGEENVEHTYYVDSVMNSKVCYYRVVGMTSFGEKGPPSNVVSGSARKDLTGMLILRELKRDDKNKKITFSWEFPPAFESEIKSFIIEKAPKESGPYATVKTITNKKGRTVEETFPEFSSYYRMKVFDDKGNELCISLPHFFHVEDNTPPLVPSELKGVIDQQGIAYIYWKGNTDPDLQGYRVFSSNDLSQDFMEITTEIVTNPEFIDTVNVNVLNKKIYYKIVAVDYNFNNSDYSKPVSLIKPDIIPPSAPVFVKVEKKEKTVFLSWLNSLSDDVSHYELYRETEDDYSLTKVLSWPVNKKINEHTDGAVLPGKKFHYVLYAYDSSGNVGTTRSTTISFISYVRNAVDDITATIERDKKLITLSWKYSEEPKQCILFRRKNNEPFTLYKTLEGNVDQFTDNQVIVNNTYSYKIQLVFDRNVKSTMSKELKVPF